MEYDKVLKKNKYELAIQNKDITAVFEEFNKDLENFINECRRIRTEFAHCQNSDPVSARHLKMEYSRLWSKFIHHVPFPYYEKYIGSEEQIRLSEILPRGKKISGYESYLQELLEYVVRYNAYILQQTNLAYREIIIFSSLKTVAKSIDLFPMTIYPSLIIKKVDEVMMDMKNGKLKRPLATFWNGELYENQKMNSSSKVARYRGMRLCEFLHLFIDDYKSLNNGELPNRKEVKEHLIKRCASSGDERLAVFANKMNDKTLTKLIDKGGFQNLISTKRKRENVVPVELAESLNSKERMTLYEVYTILKDGFDKLKKNNK